MSRFDSIYVPDELWRDFQSGDLDHFEYGDPISVGVYVDGRRVEFDSTVTHEMREAERVKRRQAILDAGGYVSEVRFTAKFDSSKFHGLIYNAGS